jgi:tRNA dimethylallyltransferase
MNARVMKSNAARKPLAFCLMGPTASGKTALALALAQRFPVEIISVDSALVYQDMNIGTAKPTAEEQAACPHHLIDRITPEMPYSAARFCQEVREALTVILGRGHIPLLVGGTLLYFKALREGLSDLPSANPALRAELEAQAQEEGWPALHRHLARMDPETALRLAPTDAQRIQRALEIVLGTGKPLALAPHTPPDWPCEFVFWGLAPSNRAVLHSRIEQRFGQMLQKGLVDELRGLKSRYHLHPGLPAMRCVGYRQTWEYLEGTMGPDALMFKGVVATRQLAKRQLTWLRQFQERWPDLETFDCLDPRLCGQLIERMTQALDSPSTSSLYR